MISRLYPAVLLIIVNFARCEVSSTPDDMNIISSDTETAGRNYKDKETAALSMLADTLGQLSALLKKNSALYQLPSSGVDVYQAVGNQPYEQTTPAPNYPAAYYQVTPALPVQYPPAEASYLDYSANPSSASASLVSAYYPPELYPVEQPTPAPYAYAQPVTTPLPYVYPRYLQRAMRPGSMYFDRQENGRTD